MTDDLVQLKDAVNALRHEVHEIREKVDTLTVTVSLGRGAVHALMWIGGLIVAIITAIGALSGYFKH